MGTPLVSVVIPTFNRKAFLREAIASVLDQRHNLSIEILVVDDGSTDGTAEALADLLSHPAVRYFHQPNFGRPAAARNRGIREAKGDLVAFLDSDDLLLPDSIARRTEVFQKVDDVDFVCTNWLSLSGSLSGGTRPSVVSAKNLIDHLPRHLVNFRENGLVVFDPAFVYELFNSDFVATSSVMVRRRVFPGAGVFDESLLIGEDYDLWMRIGLKSRIAFLEEPLTLFRSHDSHITGNELLNFKEDKKVINNFLQRSHPVPDHMKSRLNRRLALFYFAGGKAFLRAGDRVTARSFFLTSLRHDPYSWQAIKHAIGCAF